MRVPEGEPEVFAMCRQNRDMQVRVLEVQRDHVIVQLDNLQYIGESFHTELFAMDILVEPLEVQDGPPGPPFLGSKKVVGVKAPGRN